MVPHLMGQKKLLSLRRRSLLWEMQSLLWPWLKTGCQLGSRSNRLYTTYIRTYAFGVPPRNPRVNRLAAFCHSGESGESTVSAAGFPQQRGFGLLAVGLSGAWALSPAFRRGSAGVVIFTVLGSSQSQQMVVVSL